jgi:hypothetical protein
MEPMLYETRRKKIQDLSTAAEPKAHYPQAITDPLDKRGRGGPILKFVGAKTHGCWQEYSWSSSPFERSAAMATPPCS